MVNLHFQKIMNLVCCFFLERDFSEMFLYAAIHIFGFGVECLVFTMYGTPFWMKTEDKIHAEGKIIISSFSFAGEIVSCWTGFVAIFLDPICPFSHAFATAAAR